MNITCYEENAKEVRVRIDDFEKYKSALLVISNTIRHESLLYNVHGMSDTNDLFVTCAESELEACKEWLEHYGKIISVLDVLVLKAEEPDYDVDKYWSCEIYFE